jgi:hypothetical protein
MRMLMSCKWFRVDLDNDHLYSSYSIDKLISISHCVLLYRFCFAFRLNYFNLNPNSVFAVPPTLRCQRNALREPRPPQPPPSGSHQYTSTFVPSTIHKVVVCRLPPHTAVLDSTVTSLDRPQCAHIHISPPFQCEDTSNVTTNNGRLGRADSYLIS